MAYLINPQLQIFEAIDKALDQAVAERRAFKVQRAVDCSFAKTLLQARGQGLLDYPRIFGVDLAKPGSDQTFVCPGYPIQPRGSARD